MHDWLEQNAPGPMGLLNWFGNRLNGTRCYATGCGRLLLLHAPWQSYHCNRTPLSLELTEQGWLYGHGIDPASIGPAPVLRGKGKTQETA